MNSTQSVLWGSLFVMGAALGNPTRLPQCFAQTTASPFFDQLKANFPVWDADNDGALSANEIELAVHDPEVKGSAAAAAATLRRVIRGNSSIKSLSLDEIRAAIPYDANATPKQPKYESLYDSSLKKIGVTRRELFVSGLPNVDTLGQGKLGDCFLLVSLGTLAHQDPQRLKNLMQPEADGKVAVSFGNGQKIVLPPPTDAEVVIGASTLNDGTWAIMMEKAIGQIYLERQKTPRHVTPLSIIGVGGTPNTPMGFITGHKSIRVGCEDFQKGTMDAATRETRLAAMRVSLTEALSKGKMIVSGTAPIGKQAIVRGLYYNHSYGVLGFDPKTDEVTFWNPFGNKFTPKGQPGLKNGYVTEHGRFQVPLAEAVQWLGSFSIESDQPAE
jgi:hypothetical protein